MQMRTLLDQVGRHARLLTAALLVTCAGMTTAGASDRSCRQIEARLAALPATGRVSSGQTKRYDAAIARQQQQMQKAREQGRQAGCGSAMSGRAVAFCASLNATLDRMQGNLANLQKQRASASGGDSRRERARLQAALRANDCLVPASRQPTVTDSREQSNPSGSVALRTANLRGNFRTMCVRTCDGYYFPVSTSVPASGFARDQAVCQSLCPAAEVELHYHRMPGQEAEDMVSATTGLPYRQMSNAFVYRKPSATVAPACGCGAVASPQQSRGFAVIGGDYASRATENSPDEGAVSAIPQPSTRPDPAEDPDTLISREGGLDVETLRQISAQAPSPAVRIGIDEGTESRPVRVVGPRFLPDPEAAAGPPVPDHAPAQ